MIYLAKIGVSDYLYINRKEDDLFIKLTPRHAIIFHFLWNFLASRALYYIAFKRNGIAV